MLTKPPLGVMPRWLWDEKHPEPTDRERITRRQDVFDAIRRYVSEGRVYPVEWDHEIEQGE